MCSLSKEHLLLAPEARLGSRAPGSEMPTLLVSPVAGLTSQVSMCPIRVGACAAGGQGPALVGLLFLWGGCDRGDILAPSLRSWCLTGSEWHEGGGHTVTWGKGSNAGSPKEGADLAGWRNSRKTSVSEESEQGDGRELVSKQWAGDQKWDGSLGWSRAEEGCGLMWELRKSCWALEGWQKKQLQGLVKLRRPEVWAQARVSVSRATVTKLGDFKQQKFIVFLFCRLRIPNPGAGRAVLSLKAPGDNSSF